MKRASWKNKLLALGTAAALVGVSVAPSTAKADTPVVVVVVVVGGEARNLGPVVMLATTLSFLTAPVLAWLNHRAITSDALR
ncbi:MAG: hypothetical protein JKY37_07470, partial [Nannocystaceae bacterium]|nr:hypothetical protein [Nannocystaceae bacterium]